MKFIGKVILACFALALAFYTISFAIYIVGSITKQMTLSTLKNPADVALACRAAIQALGTNEYATFEGDDPTLPATLRELKPHYVLVETESLRAEFHGGFDHYGLEFRPKIPEQPGGTWILNYYTESPERKQLYELK